MNDFDRSQFFPLKNIINTSDINKILKLQVLDFKNYKSFDIMEISSLNMIRNNSVIFLDKKLDINNFNFANILIITNHENIFSHCKSNNIILVNDINESYNLICNHLFFHEDGENSYDEFELNNGSYISKEAKIDPSTIIGKNCFIGRGVQIGSYTKIKNNVVIKNSIIGSNVIISDNSTIGSTGFGFSLRNMGAQNIYPHIGIVLIEDNVRIGSNCTIDRGKIDYTFIGKNSMLDNQIHIAHNVIINSNACIAAQSGISGSVIIGNNLIAGGQSGFAGHISIGDNVIVAAKSGVTKNISSKSSVAGYPATDINKWKKNIIKQRKDL